MTRLLRAGLAAVALATAAGAGLVIGRNGLTLPPALGRFAIQPAQIEPSRSSPLLSGSGPVVYYRDPDGKPSYSLEAATTRDGRPYRPVLASEDVRFGEIDQGEPPGGAAPKVPRKILYYRNPMGLPDTSKVPKKDSMGMDYLPVYEGDADDGGIVKVAPGKMQITGVRTERASERLIDRTIRVPGSIQLDERRVTIVAPRSESFLNKVENVTIGDRVRKGQPLVELYSPEINLAAAQLVAAVGFEGSRRRLRNLNVSDAMIAEIERTHNVPLSIIWSSPRDGIVMERNAIEGMRAGPGDVLFRIADISVVWALADVPEFASGALKIGQTVAVRVRSLPNLRFQGRIALIYPQINKETRTTRIRVELANPDAVLLPDMYAEAEIAVGNPGPVLAVPSDSIVDNGTRQIVLVERGEGRFEPRVVTAGTRGGGYVEIRSGLTDGEKVVTSANFLIDAESNLKAALNAMAEPGEGQMGEPR